MPRNVTLNDQMARILLRRAEKFAEATDDEFDDELVVSELGRLIKKLNDKDTQTAIVALTLQAHDDKGEGDAE